MKYVLFAAILCCPVAVVAAAQNTPPKKAVTPAKKTSPSVSQKTTTAGAGKTGVSKPASTTTASTTHTPQTQKTTARSTTPNRRYYASRQPVRRYSGPQIQQAPTADRYREIQDALAAKGYLKTPPTGVWDKDSIDAMTRFQQDQKLEATGKLTARSLGALGLGPKPGDTSSPSAEATPLQ
jgi:glucan-binding YG repeat protein